MSALYLLIALVGPFASVAAVVMRVAQARASRRRAVEILQTQVEPVPLANIREQELHQPFGERAMKPLLTTVARTGRRLTPLDVRDRLARKIILAGSPTGWDADKFAAGKVGGLVGGVLLGAFVGHVMALAGLTYIFIIAAATAAGYFLPDVVVSRSAEARQKGIQRA